MSGVGLAKSCTGGGVRVAVGGNQTIVAVGVWVGGRGVGEGKGGRGVGGARHEERVVANRIMQAGRRRRSITGIERLWSLIIISSKRCLYPRRLGDVKINLQNSLEGFFQARQSSF